MLPFFVGDYSSCSWSNVGKSNSLSLINNPTESLDSRPDNSRFYVDRFNLKRKFGITVVDFALFY
jgi:hypothetical protein